MGTSAVLTDPARLRSVRSLAVGPAPDAAFDRIAALVERLIEVPAAMVCVVDAERQVVAGQVGLPEPLRARREVELDHWYSKHVVLEGRPVVIADVLVDPRTRDSRVVDGLGARSYVGVPLTDADGRTLGTLCAYDVEPRQWTPSELALLTDLAAVCSSELRLRIAHVHAQHARRQAESAHQQLAMLAELTEALASTMDIDEALARLSRGVTPRMADWCFVALTAGNGSTRLVSAAHHDPARDADMARLAELAVPALAPNAVVLAVQRTGRPIRRDEADTARLPATSGHREIAEIARRAGFGSYLIAPITAPISRHIVGAVTFVNGPDRPPFTDAQVGIALDIGRRAGLAVDNSRLYRRQRHVAEVLQHSMLTELPRIEGFALHGRYVPAQDGAAVGGDWYDAFAQPDGSVMVAVGDVSGHDIEAAATMGQLRNLVRGDAYGRDDEPGPLLGRLDRAVHGLAVSGAATAVLARLRREPGGYVVTFANAGHPPPVLLRPDGGTEVWWVDPEPLLGLLPRTERTTHSRRVPAGSTLLLYTDGLVEDRTSMIDTGIARIASLLRAGSGTADDELCTRLLESTSRRTDDIALLLIRLG